jgi:Rnl2 family RNA ligase
MSFKKYNSIENGYRTAFINKIREYGLDSPDVLYIANEKIHGANYSFVYDVASADIRPAKRTAFIEENENFYGHEYVFEKYKESAINVSESIASAFKMADRPIKSVILYGELAGGSGDGFKQVQREVYYSDELEFYLFDIAIDEGTDEMLYLDQSMLYQHEEIVGKFVLPPIIARGPLDYVLQISPEFNSFVSDKENNPAEGFVIKPDKNVVLPNGKRVIIKVKSEAFSEKKNRKPKKKVEFDAQQQLIFDNMMMYITENRLKNVLSHMGEINQKDFGKVNSAFTADIYNDYHKEHPNALASLDKAKMKQVSKAISNETAKMIRTNFVNIIDGQF